MTNTTTKISAYQIGLLMVICRIITAYSYLPILGTPPANQDVWAVIPISLIYTLILCLPLLYLGSKLAGLSLLDYSELVMGKIGGKIVCALYSLFFIFLSFMQMAVLQDFIHTVILTRTPVYVILFFVAVYVATLFIKA